MKRLGGGYWRLVMRLLGYGTAFWVEAGPECLGGGGVPSPRFKRFPGGGGATVGLREGEWLVTNRRFAVGRRPPRAAVAVDAVL